MESESLITAGYVNSTSAQTGQLAGRAMYQDGHYQGPIKIETARWFMVRLANDSHVQPQAARGNRFELGLPSRAAWRLQRGVGQRFDTETSLCFSQRN